MTSDQEAAWSTLLDLHERLGTDWTLVGGQMVHLWCAERGVVPPRPTDDVDAVVDVRSSPSVLRRFTAILVDLGLSPETSGDGLHHRWVGDRGGAKATVDVMLPDGVGGGAASREGAGGAPTLTTAGGTQALQRSESVRVQVGTRAGWVRRPGLLGALVMKAAAHGSQPGGPGARHRQDFAVLVSMLGRRDLEGVHWTPKDRSRLRSMVVAVRADRPVLVSVPDAGESMQLLEEWMTSRLT